MANPYTATLRAAADDGTNMYLFVEITDGTRTMPIIQVTLPSSSTAALITTYMRNMATNQPTVGATIQALINSPIQGS